MERTTGTVAVLVGVLVLGAAVWILTTSPLLGLLGLLGGLVMWEVGRRTRYRGRLRFLPGRPSTRRVVVVNARRYHRTPWHRPAGAPEVLVVSPARPRRPGPRPGASAGPGQRPRPRPSPGGSRPRPSPPAPRRNGSRP